VNKEEW